MGVNRRCNVSTNQIKLNRVKGGWAAHGEGWAVHAPTQEEARAKHKERVAFYRELATKPFWYENPENPKVQLQRE